MSNYFIALLIFLFSFTSSFATDLQKIERKLVKEPSYRGKPQYCLLVFGPEAKTRVWLVRDGDTLYVDRNANGDLTEPGEKVSYKKAEGYSEPNDGVYFFEIGEIQDGPLLHKNITVSFGKIDYLAEQDEIVKKLLIDQPTFRGVRINAEIETSGRHGTGVDGRLRYSGWPRDARGFLQFADQPKDAPIIHFGGEWSITQFDPNVLQPGRQIDFVLGVGTIGLGAGTTVYVSYEDLIPDSFNPKLSVTYPPQKPGDPPITAQYELKERC